MGKPGVINKNKAHSLIEQFNTEDKVQRLLKD